ncbi:hypothetical protein [Sicyoidochytrium minutum DNA virus]|nr:hypothetical protein [Sicyoidochytrium minutum DNA virus]
MMEIFLFLAGQTRNAAQKRRKNKKNGGRGRSL